MQVHPAPPSGLKTAGLVALIFAVVLACYWPALSGAMLWDDSAHVPSPGLRSLAGLHRIWFDLGATQQYYPVLFSAFWAEHRLWGDSVPAYHLANVLFHASSCCVFALLLRRLWSGLATPAPAGFTVPPGAAWLAALLLAVHPVCVESVAWISEQKNTLSLLFYLLAALAYVTYRQRRHAGWYALASGLFLLALGTKTVTATLPAALLVVLWWRQGRLAWREDVRPLLAWFVAAAASGLLTAWVERKFIGAEGARFDLSLVERALLAGRVFWFYLGQTLWPSNLAFFYRRWDVAAEAPAWTGYLLAGIGVTIGLWLLRKRTRGPLAAWLLFAGSLFPALGFFNVYPFRYSYVADHFQYLASLGLIAAAAGGAGILLAKCPAGGRTAGWAACALLLAGLAGLSHEQSRLYRDAETLYRATLARTPDSWMAHHILGVALARTPEGRPEAMIHFQEAIRLNPNYPDARLYRPSSWPACPAGRRRRSPSSNTPSPSGRTTSRRTMHWASSWPANPPAGRKPSPTTRRPCG